MWVPHKELKKKIQTIKYQKGMQPMDWKFFFLLFKFFFLSFIFFSDSRVSDRQNSSG